MHTQSIRDHASTSHKLYTILHKKRVNSIKKSTCIVINAQLHSIEELGGEDHKGEVYTRESERITFLDPCALKA